MTPEQKTATAIGIRLMTRSDMPTVLQIEALSFPEPWTEEDFLRCCRQRNIIPMVAEAQAYSGDGHEPARIVVGFVLYELRKTRLNLVNLAVRPEWRLCGVGRKLIGKLLSKLNEQRPRLTAEISEYGLDAQLFFRACGLKAVKVLRDYFDSGEAAYVFETGEMPAPVVRAGVRLNGE